MADTIANLEQLLPINAHDLEGERRTQHDKFYAVSKKLSFAISRKDAAKKAVKEVDARVSESLRKSWKESDGKMTEKALADKVLLHADMIDANDELLVAERQALLWWSLKDAFEQRNNALEQLIKLYLSERFGESRLERAAYQPTRDDRPNNRY